MFFHVLSVFFQFSFSFLSVFFQFSFSFLSVFFQLSFSFFQFLSFFFHFLCLCWVLKIFFFGPSISLRFSLDNSYVKNQFFWAHLARYKNPFGPSFPTFPIFFYCFCLFFIFSHFLFISSFLKCFSFFPKKKFLLFFSLVFLSKLFHQSLTVSSVVGAPWRCGVLTT